MYAFMTMKQRMKISKGGQLSIPAPIRKRWGTTAVTISDEGERLIVEPAPEDPIDAVAGSLSEYFAGVNLQELRDERRREEEEIENRKLRQHGWSS